jgi:assimilatory nitrate reductase catalytic subunit
VHVTSRRGSILVPVQASTEVALNQAFMAMHWGDEVLSGVSANGQRLGGVNALTNPAYCPDSKQPEFKHAAVKVVKADMPWTLLGMAWLDDAQWLTVRQQLQELMPAFAYASCVPFSGTPNAKGEARSGVLFRAAHTDAAPAAVVQQIETLLQLAGTDVVRYADAKRGQRRAVRLVRGDVNTTLEGFLLAGDTRAQGWMGTLLQDEQPAQSYGRAWLAPGATPVAPVVSRGKTVCTCFNVTDVDIDAQLAQCTGNAADRLSSLQGALRCGTNCGSCVPQLQRMVRTSIAMTKA